MLSTSLGHRLSFAIEYPHELHSLAECNDA